jgi:hypothetical protein
MAGLQRRNKAIYAILAMKRLGIEGPRRTVPGGHYENPYYVQTMNQAQGGSEDASRCAGGLWAGLLGRAGRTRCARTTAHSEPCDGPLVWERDERSWGRV